MNFRCCKLIVFVTYCFLIVQCIYLPLFMTTEHGTQVFVSLVTPCCVHKCTFHFYVCINVYVKLDCFHYHSLLRILLYMLYTDFRLL